MPTFSCPACAMSLNIDDLDAGLALNCPRCAVAMTIPPISRVTGAPAELATSPMDAPRRPAVDTLTDFLRPPQANDELGWLGPFRIRRILGSGGMGVVFEAEDVKLQRTVALKAMLPSIVNQPTAAERFLREARSMARVQHPHVARIYQVDEDRGVPFLAMEFLRGQSLDARLKQLPVFPLEETLRVARQIAEGLGAAHALGLVHRDIKPANIWLEFPSDTIKILDFGLARPERTDKGSPLTKAGLIVGTPAFMSPEQSRGTAVDARTDLFALGVVLYRMTTGKLPFDEADAVATMVATQTKTPPSPSQVQASTPRWLDALIMKLLAKAPKDRYQSTAEVLAALTPPAAAPPRRVMPAVLVALAAAAVLVVAAPMLLNRPQPVVPVDIGKDPVKKPPEIEAPAGFPVDVLESPKFEWSAPAGLGPGGSFGKRNIGLTLSSDERILVYSSDRRLRIARRASKDEPFPASELVWGDVNWAGETPSISGDGLLLAFSSGGYNPGKDEEDIWIASRKSIDEPFGEPVKLPAPVNSAGVERGPVLSADGLTLLVTTIGRGGLGGGDITQFTRKSRDEPFGNQLLLPAPVNTKVFNGADWISPDGRVLFTTKMGATQPFEVRYFVRPMPGELFGPARQLGPPFTTFTTFGFGRPWLSPDARRIYFHSRDVPESNGEMQLWMCRREEK